MKTIFLTISRGTLARNLLQNEFFLKLREHYKVVVLTPAYKDEQFLKTFSHPNAIFENFDEYPWSWWETILGKLHKMLIFNASTELKSRYGIVGLTKKSELSDVRFFAMKAIFWPLSKIKFIRDVVRWVDNATTQKELRAKCRALIKHHQPSLIFSTNITSDSEVALVKEGKAQGVVTVAMPKSWDNLSWIGFRVKADYCVVWNQFMYEQALIYQNYKPHQVHMVGVPQFDDYANTQHHWKREDFCKKYGLDPKRKIIFFGSEGKLFDQHDREVSSQLYDLIATPGALAEPCQLLIRPHYAYKDEARKFDHIAGKPHVVIDSQFHASPVFKDQWDYSREFMDRFLNSLLHADVTVNTCSTLTLDAAALDRPIVNIAFDGYRTLPYEESIVRWYDNDYYKDVLNTGATSMARSPEELKQCIATYLANPADHAEGRARLRDRFCFKIDGKAGQRLFNLIDGLLK